MDAYKTANMHIATTCRTISQKLLIKVDEKRVYENLEFDDAQVRSVTIIRVTVSISEP